MDTPDKPEGLRVGDNVAIRLASGTDIKFYQIVNRDTIFFPDTQSAVAAGATSDYSEISEMDPPSMQLYHVYTVMIDGNVKIYLKQPAAINRWGTNKSPDGGYLTDTLSGMGIKQLINLWIMEDYPPNIKIVNPTNISITPKLYWFGWRYQLKKLDVKPAIFTTVNVGGLSE